MAVQAYKSQHLGGIGGSEVKGHPQVHSQVQRDPGQYESLSQTKNSTWCGMQAVISALEGWRQEDQFKVIFTYTSSKPVYPT